jgi:hypothetical protein
MLLLAAGGCTTTFPGTERCTASEGSRSVEVSRNDRVDVLFVIDDGDSMALEQAALARELPDMVRAMTEGAMVSDIDRIDPVESLHLGVISSDLGLGSMTSEPSCSALGDDGVMRHPEACGTGDAPFVWHFSGYHDAEQTNAAISCNAKLGTKGCANAQPLEAVLKALRPSDHGETDNRGFLRSSSLLLIIVITDKDDCSLADATSPDVATAEANCARGSAVHAVSRYVTELRALRDLDLTRIAIIAGLPADLEDDASIVSRGTDAYYDRVLADPRMHSNEPSCESADASAQAPRRLIELARAFGSDASVISICRANWKRALVAQLRHLAGAVPVCVPPHSERVENERSTCRVTWELPVQVGPEQPLTPVRCSDQPEFLSTPEAPFPRVSERGRTLCEVRAAPFVENSDGGVVVDGEGFYTPAARWCRKGSTNAEGRILQFTDHAKAPDGVTVRLTCTTSECQE